MHHLLKRIFQTCLLLVISSCSSNDNAVEGAVMNTAVALRLPNGQTRQNSSWNTRLL